MRYKTLLVHVESGSSNAALLDVACRFADRFEAHVIGIACCQPLIIVSGDGSVCGDVFTDDQRRMAVDLGVAEAEFRDAFRAHGAGLEWRSEITIAAPASFLASHACSADLVLTRSMPPDDLDLSRAANTGSLVMGAGRPVFIAPAQTPARVFDSALIGWNDSRECRRAIADALPLLAQTKRVTVLAIASADGLDAAQAQVRDVVAWLGRHGVVADGRTERSTGSDPAQLRAAADASDVDVIVAGAYGHSRLREWALGGVTRNLLLESRRGVLVSH